MPDADVVVALVVGGTGSTAAEGEEGDYTLGSTDAVSITIPAGSKQGTASITVDPVQDSIDEGESETITVTGTLTSTGGDVDEVIGTQIEIADDDTASTVIDLSVDVDAIEEGSQAVVGEGAGSAQVVLTATLRGTVSRSTDTVVSVSSALGGSATGGGTDYANPTLPTSITIPAGELSGSAAAFTLTVTADTTREGDETVEFSGSAGGLSVLGATLVIADDDFAAEGLLALPGPVTLDPPVRSPRSTSALLSWSAPQNPPDRRKGRLGGYRVERRSLTDPAGLGVAPGRRRHRGEPVPLRLHRRHARCRP